MEVAVVKTSYVDEVRAELGASAAGGEDEEDKSSGEVGVVKAGSRLSFIDSIIYVGLNKRDSLSIVQKKFVHSLHSVSIQIALSDFHICQLTSL